MKKILLELKEHIPFTALGALGGAVFMLFFINYDLEQYENIFHVFHPAHIFVSALVTTAMYRRYGGSVLWGIILGASISLLFCTLSDAILPYLGSRWLGSDFHLHLDIIEHPWLVLIPALIGGGLGSWLLHTKFSHSIHVLLSTTASLFYLLAFTELPKVWLAVPAVFAILFFSVWLPCCLGDIALPIWIKKK